jgi:hypothetical protein
LSAPRGIPPLRAQKLAELQELGTAWPGLSPELRTAVLAVTRTSHDLP